MTRKREPDPQDDQADGLPVTAPARTQIRNTIESLRSLAEAGNLKAIRALTDGTLARLEALDPDHRDEADRLTPLQKAAAFEAGRSDLATLDQPQGVECPHCRSGFTVAIGPKLRVSYPPPLPRHHRQ